MLEFEVSMLLRVDPDANFIENDRHETPKVLLDLIKLAVYDIDDVKIKLIEVEEVG